MMYKTCHHCKVSKDTLLMAMMVVLTDGSEVRFCHVCAEKEEHLKSFLQCMKAYLPGGEENTEKPLIVCLCGSGRFKEAFEQAEYDLTLEGIIVLTIGCNTKDVARDPELESHKPALDELHLRKIDLADEVLILNVDGYIGESTRNELEYARKRGKKIRYLVSPVGES